MSFELLDHVCSVLSVSGGLSDLSRENADTPGPHGNKRYAQGNTQTYTQTLSADQFLQIFLFQHKHLSNDEPV